MNGEIGNERKKILGKHKEKRKKEKHSSDYHGEMLELTVHIGHDIKIYNIWGDINKTREDIRNGKVICRYNGAKDYTIINTKACSIIDLKVAEKGAEKENDDVSV